MNNFGFFVDVLLFLLVAYTFILITFKTLDLFWPELISRTGLAQAFGSDEDSLQAGLELKEFGLAGLAIMASTAPFIGLMGTVIHIMEALRNLGAGSADMALISGPIATALNSTLVGMCAAIPAGVAQVLFARRIALLESRHRRSFKQENS